MAANPIDPVQPAAISRFAKLWPLLLSAIVLLISGGFLWLNLYMFPGEYRDFALLTAHSSLITFPKTLPNGTIPVGVIIWIVAGIVLAVIARTIVGKVALVFSFAVAIPIMFVGFLFGWLVDFSPVDSLILSSNSFNLGYFDDSSGTGMFYFYECDSQRLNCKKIWQLRSPYEPQSVTVLQFDDSNSQVEILIDGEIVYTHPIE